MINVIIWISERYKIQPITQQKYSGHFILHFDLKQCIFEMWFELPVFNPKIGWSLIVQKRHAKIELHLYPKIHIMQRGHKNYKSALQQRQKMGRQQFQYIDCARFNKAFFATKNYDLNILIQLWWTCKGFCQGWISIWKCCKDENYYDFNQPGHGRTELRFPYLLLS